MSKFFISVDSLFLPVVMVPLSLVSYVASSIFIMVAIILLNSLIDN